ncbi:MAG TPA: DNA alkylation repair protein [Bacteroidia bacterium]|nr:DNA alkylation repair protein [Bacteroidia bacterium]HNT79634.1 DNA alkylation repair protein [Bacteroidia bacterium]
MNYSEIITHIQSNRNQKNIDGQARFGIKSSNSYGWSKPDIKSLARKIGKNHLLALELWDSQIHDARHLAIMIAEKKKVSEKVMDSWCNEFYSWDIVDDCCSKLFCRTPFAYEKAYEWTSWEGEFQRRAGFSMMAFLAVHDKKAGDEKFISFFPYYLKYSNDERNYVKKAIHWAMRQSGKRNMNLCNRVLELAEEMKQNQHKVTRWIASEVIKELSRYKAEGKIKNLK